MTAASPWSVSDVKARLLEILEHAHSWPQIITEAGEPCAVILSLRDFEDLGRVTRRQLRDLVLTPAPVHALVHALVPALVPVPVPVHVHVPASVGRAQSLSFTNE